MNGQFEMKEDGFIRKELGIPKNRNRGIAIQSRS